LNLAKATWTSLGATDFAYVVVPHPMGGIALDEIRAKADAAFPAMLEIAQKWTPAAATVDQERKPYPARQFTFTGTETDASDLCYKRGWTDGLPIVAPTVERVNEMLKGTSSKPGDIIGNVPPRNGILTVELAATFAVMAGAKPEHLPVILASAEALLNPKHDLRGATTTTNPCAILIVVNGPVRDELGIQYGVGALAPSPSGQANAVIGRAVNMMMDVVGDSQPPKDMSTLGNPGSYTMVMGENEQANPWKTLAVQQGAKPGASTVTVFEVRSFVNNNLHEPTKPETLLHPMAKAIAPVSGLAESGLECSPDARDLLVLGPEHADTIAKSGWSLEQVQEYIFENSRVAKKDYLIRMEGKEPSCRKDEENISILPSPKGLAVMVAGGPGKHSVYMDTSRYIPITVEIDKYRAKK
jgi:hypothetical protein